MQLPYFYEPSASAINAILMLDEDTSKHCVQVLRMKEGAKLQLTNGKGSLFTAAIVKADKKYCSVRTDETIYQKREGKKICIAISLLKNAGRWEWFLEKAVEMGISEIIPLLCGRTEKQQFKKERLQNIAVSAMLQSRQVWLPQLHLPAAFEEVISSSGADQKLIAHCLDEGSKKTLAETAIEDAVQMLIGPEGDFTEKEIKMALQNGYQPVSLGNTRLRTETAGVVASALLIHSHQ